MLRGGIKMEFRAKRELGEGRWDKILKRKLTELSVSDDYEVAKHEWIATGEVWWSGSAEQPDWVNHAGSCLCGHIVVYHFQILNTVNNTIECVGSDHINTYLIMRAIAEDNNLDINTITDEQIQEWIDVRTKSMKAEAWWKDNGVGFEMMFDKVKEIDLIHNVHNKEIIYDSKYQWSERRTTIRKRSEGKYGNRDYQMASIVWRWNHPDNPKAQINTTGYPNDNLMKDLAIFFIKSDPMITALNKRKEQKRERLLELEAAVELRRLQHLKAQEEREERQRLQAVEWERTRPEREARQAEQRELNRIAQELRDIKQAKLMAANKIKQEETLEGSNDKFVNLCEYYGIPAFDSSFAESAWERNFLTSVKEQMLNDKPMTSAQLQTMRRILEDSSPTLKQRDYLRDLGFDGRVSSRREASRKIASLLKEQE